MTTKQQHPNPLKLDLNKLRPRLQISALN